MNSVRYILDNRPLSHEDKIAIKALGRPVPDLQIRTRSMAKSRHFNRYFKRETTYDKFPWMCGCPITNKLFCFVCLVSEYCGCTHWTSTGVSDMQHLQQRASSHDHSVPHLCHTIDFNLLDASDVQKQLNSDYLKAVADHNKRVDKNRHMLRRLIKCLKFSGAFELPLHKRDSQGQDVFHGLLDFMSELDYSWKSLSGPKILQKSSKLIRSELLDAILQVCRNEIVDQVKRANFVALVVEDAEDSRLIIIFRYFLDGQIFERFWSVVQLEKYTAENISQVLLKELETVGLNKDKLIAQSTSIPSVVFGDVQAAIRERYPNAFLVYSYYHHFNNILQNAAFRNKKINILFFLIEGFQKFFSKFPERISVLTEVVQKKLPWVAQKTWNFETGTVNALHGKVELFRECLDEIIDKTTDMETTRAASSLLNILDFEDIDFPLEMIHHIAQHVEVFFKQVQSQEVDGRRVIEYLKEVETRISEFNLQKLQLVAVDDEFNEEEEKRTESEVNRAKLPEECTPTGPKRRRVEPGEVIDLSGIKIEVDDGMDASTTTPELPPLHVPEEISEGITAFGTASELSEGNCEPRDVKIEFKDEEMRALDVSAPTSKPDCVQADKTQQRLTADCLEPDKVQQKLSAEEYCASLIGELKEQFSFIGYISAVALFNSDKFPIYKNAFPKSIFEDTINAYPFIDKTKLKTEMNVLFDRRDISCSGLLVLLVFMYRNKLHEGFTEVYKLLDVLCTTPMATPEAERCLSTLETAKKFVTNVGSEEGLNALTMLSVEKEMVESIVGFDNRVINIFADQNGSDFKYM